MKLDITPGEGWSVHRAPLWTHGWLRHDIDPHRVAVALAEVRLRPDWAGAGPDDRRTALVSWNHRLTDEDVAMVSKAIDLARMQPAYPGDASRSNGKAVG